MKITTTPSGTDVSSFFGTERVLRYDLWDAERKLDQARQSLATFDAEVARGMEDWIAADASLRGLWAFTHDAAAREQRVWAIDRLVAFVARRRGQLAERTTVAP
jgi:hypothetical protein